MMATDFLNKRVCLLLTLVLSIFALAPLFYPGLIQTHAGLRHIWNVADLRAHFNVAAWTPSAVLAFDAVRGAGLLPYYLAAMLPVAPGVAFKIVTGLGWLLGGVGLFLWLERWQGAAAALVGAMVYLYLPYQVAAVYIRGAWGEVWVLGLLPWALLLSERVADRPRWGWSIALGLAWGLLALSQLGLAGVALLGVSLFLLVVHGWRGVLPVGLGLGGVALVGVMYGFRAPVGLAAAVAFAEHFLYPFQLVSAYWGYGASRPGWQDGLPFQVGLAGLGLSLVTLALWRQSPPPREMRPRLLVWPGLTLGLALLTLNGVGWLWAGVGAVLLTYPWQLLGLVGLGLAVLSGGAVAVEARLGRLPLLAAVILLVLLASYPYLEPEFSQAAPPAAPVAEVEGRAVLLDYALLVQSTGYTAGLGQVGLAVPLAEAGALQPGQQVAVQVRWLPVRTFGQDWKVFVHVADAGDRVIAQFDGLPEPPTSAWVPGQVIEATYPVQLPEVLPPGPYQVWLGFYEETTFERLPVEGDEQGRIVLPVE